NVGAQVPCSERSVVGWIAADDEQRLCLLHTMLRRKASGSAGECGSKRNVIRRAMVIDVVGADHRACEFLEQVILFVRCAVGADDADGVCAALVAQLAQIGAGVGQRLFPGDGLELAVFADERRCKAFDVVSEVKGVAALVAKEVAVDAGLIAVVAANDFRTFRDGADAERRLAAVAAVGAYGGDVVHLPRACLVAIGAGGQRADRAGIDAHAALFAVEVGDVFGRELCGHVGRDHRAAAAVLDAEREDVHTLAAHAYAAVAEDAARAVEVDDRRPLLFLAVVLGLGVEALGRAVLEGHVLQLALTTGVT